MRLAFGTVFAAFALCAVPATAAPVALLCTGGGISTKSHMNDDLTWSENRVPFTESFEVVLDTQTNTASIDGSPADIRSQSGDEVVVARSRRGFLGRTVGNAIAISRRTGVYRAGVATGRCVPSADAKPLF